MKALLLVFVLLCNTFLQQAMLRNFSNNSSSTDGAVDVNDGDMRHVDMMGIGDLVGRLFMSAHVVRVTNLNPTNSCLFDDRSNRNLGLYYIQKERATAGRTDVRRMSLSHLADASTTLLQQVFTLFCT